MLSAWDLVRPRYWYPMSTLEQSMMELDYLADRVFAPMRPAFAPFGRDVMRVPSRSWMRPDRVADFPFQENDDDFFRDLPMSMRPHPQQLTQQEQQKGKHTDAHHDRHTQEQQAAEPTPASSVEEAQANTTNTRGFSSYSFSSSSILDDQGRRVTNTRRRYEDSTGRLKALHEREVDGKKLRKTWSRQHKDDEGVHECVCSSGSAEEFEKMWSSTPFGEAQTKSLEDGDANEHTERLKGSMATDVDENEKMKESTPKAKL